MATIAENLQILVDNKADIKRAIERLRGETITKRMSAWADLIFDTSNTGFPYTFPITFIQVIMTSESNGPVMERLYASELILDPDELTNVEAARITSFPTRMFDSNTAITHFDELVYFTGITTIPERFCNGASNLTTVSIPPNCETVGGDAFFNIGSLACDLDMSSVESIGKQAFMNTRIVNVTLGDNLTSIGESAFYNCSQMKINTDLSSVISMGNSAFQQCFAIDTPINLDNLVGSTYRTFWMASNIPSIRFGNSVTSIGQLTIADSNVKTIEIGSGVTSIASQAFLRCNSCTSITIHALVPPTLENVDAFTTTNNCPIYVPAESVAAYQAATNWASQGLASRIQAISE